LGFFGNYSSSPSSHLSVWKSTDWLNPQKPASRQWPIEQAAGKRENLNHVEAIAWLYPQSQSPSPSTSPSPLECDVPTPSSLEPRTSNLRKNIGPQKWARQQAQFCHVGCVGLLWCYLVVFLAVGVLWILHRIGGRRCAALWLWCYTWAMADARVPGGRPKRD